MKPLYPHRSKKQTRLTTVWRSTGPFLVTRVVAPLYYFSPTINSCLVSAIY
ncbi:hypothetical protein ACO2Q8_28740 [Larkinella sp. VNQ87]|uniref:hypothetical protein n=1 Tax=Larkinella sp. VNQ87 TaxID=3400921 RepID=UPI003C10A012